MLVRRVLSNIILLIGIFTVSSCARILNSNQTSISVLVNTPVKLIHKQDTVHRLDTIHQLSLQRSKRSVYIQLYNDSLQKSVNVSSTLSPATYLNLYFGYWGIPGLIIDLQSPKGYGYPSKIYVDMYDPFSNYTKKQPKLIPYNHALKFTPLKLIGLVNPGFEIAYEYRWNNQTTTQLLTANITRNPPVFFTHPHAFDMAGFRIAAEQRYFIKQNAPEGIYVSAELDFLNASRVRREYFVREVIRDSIVTVPYLATYRNHRTFFTSSFKIGWQEVYNRFVIDMYAGIGLRYAIVTTEGKPTDPYDEYYNRHDVLSGLFDIRQGRYFTGAMPLNIRIGYLF